MKNFLEYIWSMPLWQFAALLALITLPIAVGFIWFFRSMTARSEKFAAMDKDFNNMRRRVRRESK